MKTDEKETTTTIKEERFIVDTKQDNLTRLKEEASKNQQDAKIGALIYKFLPYRENLKDDVAYMLICAEIFCCLQSS